MVYIVTYDLYNEVGPQPYQALVTLIKEEKIWARLGGSSYLIESDKSARELRDLYTSVLDRNDKIFVGKVSAPAAWYGYSEEVSKWIRNKLDK